MKNIIILALLILALLAIPDILHSAEKDQPANDPVSLIKDAYEQGSLSYDEMVIYQVMAIKGDKKFPLKYSLSISETSKANYRDATPVLIDIIQKWDKLLPETQITLSAMFARTTTSFTYGSVAGDFLIHYDTIGVNSVSPEDLDNNGIPDFIEKCAAYMDSSMAIHMSLGYLPPPSDGGLGGDNRYDIYFEDISYYGYTQPESPASMPWDDYISYIVLNDDFLEFTEETAPNNDPEGQQAGAAKVTCVHEFHHAIQLAYDIYEPSWYMELDATWMEDVGFDLVDDNYNYLDDYFYYPHTSLMDNTKHKYSCFIWNMYLSEKFDTSLLVDIWEGAKYDAIFDVLSDSLMSRYGYTQDSAFVDFTYWNYITDFRNDGNHYDEAAAYLPVAISRSHLNYPVGLQNSLTNIGGYASSYITFYPNGQIGTLEINFNGADTREWTAYIIKSTSLTEHQYEQITLDDNFDGTITVPHFQDYFSVTLVGVNTMEFSSGALFTYSADVKIPYSVSSLVQNPGDSAIYAGTTRNYVFQVTNPSEFNDIYYIIFWDDQGWVLRDTIESAIASGGTKQYNIPVKPPLGTPVGMISNIHILAESWGDSEVVDTQFVSSKCYLYRMDLDYDGIIDISDLVYFVDYSFKNGDEPLPTVLSADINCDLIVEVTDLVLMVDYFFRDGEYCACNPY